MEVKGAYKFDEMYKSQVLMHDFRSVKLCLYAGLMINLAISESKAEGREKKLLLPPFFLSIG